MLSVTSYTSRVCVKSRDYLLEEGCHAQEIASGYMKRCFCYTDHCNSTTTLTTSVFALVLCSVVSMLYNLVR